MDFYAVFSQVMVLFLILMVGFVARKLHVLNEAVTRGMSSLLLKLAMPALIIDSLQQTYSVELLRQSAVIVVIAFLVYAALAVVAFIVPKMLRIPQQELGVFRFAVLFSNVGFMGYPVVLAVFGQEGLFYAAVYNLPFNLLVFTLGIALLRLSDKAADYRITWQLFVSPVVVAVVLGFVLFAFSIALPTPILLAVRQIGSITTPLSMIVVGSLLAHIDGSWLLANWRIYVLSALRLVLIPLAVWSGLRLFTSHALLIGVPTLIAAMPAAANTAILADECNANPNFAAQVVFVSTLLSALTIPLIVYILL